MKKWVALLLIMYNSCIPSNSDRGNSYKDVMAVIDEYTQSIQQSKNVFRRIYGIDYAGQDKVYDGKIHLIDLGYSIDARMPLQDAKALFYQVADGLLEKLNSNEAIRKYFFHYPVGYQDLYISVSFDYESKGFLKKDDVYMITIMENKIMFFIVDVDEYKTETKLKSVSPGVYLQQNNPLEGLRTISYPLPEKEAEGTKS